MLVFENWSENMELLISSDWKDAPIIVSQSLRKKLQIFI